VSVSAVTTKPKCNLTQQLLWKLRTALNCKCWRQRWLRLVTWASRRDLTAE